MNVISVPTRRGIDWIKQAWQLYKAQPLPWTLATLLLLATPILIGSLVPLLGSLLGDFVQTLMGIGFYRLCRAARTKQEFDWKLLFIDLNNSKLCFDILWLKSLIALSVLLMIGLIAGSNMWLGITGKDVVSLAQIIHTKTFYLIPKSLLMILLIDAFVLMLFGALLGMAITFAAPLIAFHDQTATKALRESLRANIKNVGPFLILFLASLPLFVLAVLPMGLGLLVMMPLMLLSLCLAFDEIFSASTNSP